MSPSFLCRYRNFDTSKHRTFDMSKYIKRVLPSILWHPRVIYADTEPRIPCLQQISKRHISTTVVFFLSISYTKRKTTHTALPRTNLTVDFWATGSVKNTERRVCGNYTYRRDVLKSRHFRWFRTKSAPKTQ